MSENGAPKPKPVVKHPAERCLSLLAEHYPAAVVLVPNPDAAGPADHVRVLSHGAPVLWRALIDAAYGQTFPEGGGVDED